MAINEESSKLSYMTDGTGTPVTTSVYNVEFATPDSQFYMMCFDFNTDLDHPVVSWQVMVSCGQLKGYIGLIKDADNYGVTVELEACLVLGQLPCQCVGWSDFTLILNEVGVSGSTSLCTKTPLPTTTPIRLTPEPDDKHLQWLLSDDM
ncbi:hypothetical protein EI94DRAFT_1824112 [Lactarius quietus]|nr:hypothetical protein EI94DRAFT_1824112 [Lactarius quietus]